jgi:2-desacetyl-2-hydroxyethyl bacteriochlorophyllide A dehydrogenase
MMEELDMEKDRLVIEMNVGQQTHPADKEIQSGRFTGELFFPGDSGYEEARVGRVFNSRRPQRYPAAVLLAETERDLVEGVRLALERGWQVAVRAGGHSWAAWSVRDKALLIDLGRYKEILYDVGTSIVTVTPSVKGGDELDPFLAVHDRFFAGGHCPSVGVGGFLLQGGMGWNCRGWGWAAESIVAIDIVTAEGQLVRADATQHSDLFWAARGSGPGFFGVISRFHLQTRPRPKFIGHSVYMYPIELFDEVMTWLQGVHGSVSSDVEIVAVSMTPPGDVPGHKGGHVLLVTGVALVDTHEQAKEALAPLGGCPAVDRALMRVEAIPSSFAEQRAEQTRANPEGHRYVVDNAWIEGAPDVVVPAIRGAFVNLPTPKAFTIWFSMAPLRRLPDMALSLQTEIYLATYVVYEDEADDERCRDWVAEQMKLMEPVTAGQYLGDSDLSTRQVKFLEDAQWERFLEIRDKRDPDRLFVGYLATDKVPLNTNHWQHNMKHRGGVRMKAAVYNGVRDVTLEERPKPIAEPGEVVVKVKYCGICGTDLHSYLHEGIIAPGTIFGHETVGTVHEIGSGVEGWKVGDRVAVGPPGHCGECYNCRQGRPNICKYGFSRTTGISPATDGSYAEYVKVKYPKYMLLKIPDHVSFEEAVLFDIIGVPFHGIRRSNFRMGDNVVVVGAGPIGLCAVLLLKMGGAKHITVLEPTPKKRELALKFGADLALDPIEEGAALQDKIIDIYDGIGADVVYECAGNPNAIRSAISVVKSGGQLLVLGISEKEMPIVPAYVCPREIDIKTSFVYDGDEIRIILGLMETGRINAKEMVTDIIGLDDVVEKGFKQLETSVDQVKILLAPHDM